MRWPAKNEARSIKTTQLKTILSLLKDGCKTSLLTTHAFWA
ncbi:hypothetical protein EV06_2052 [Prochlorococcus sp. MIT 0602]|nr:hypothetical protein EV06_2052 [Prochlorococcus sp. MIT 0602]